MPIPSRPFWVTSGNKRSKVKGNTNVQNAMPTTTPNDGDCWFSPDDRDVYFGYNGEFINYFPVTYGYVAGGRASSGSAISSIERFEFPFDSGVTTIKGNLSTNRENNSTGCNSSQYGFHCGGRISSGNFASIIDRLEFPFDSGNASHVGNLSGSKIQSGLCNSSQNGYVMGGHTGTSRITTIDKFIFPFNSGTASHVGDLTAQLYLLGACNSSTHGYSLAGYSSSPYDTTYVHRITFPFNSGTASHIGNLSQSVNGMASCNSSIHGYTMCGHNHTTGNSSYIQRITFPFNSGTGTLNGNLNVTIAGPGGCNSSEHGFCVGGGPAYFNYIQRITFPHDSGTASNVGNLQVSRYQVCGIDGTDFVSMFV